MLCCRSALFSWMLYQSFYLYLAFATHCGRSFFGVCAFISGWLEYSALRHAACARTNGHRDPSLRCSPPDSGLLLGGVDHAMRIGHCAAPRMFCALQMVAFPSSSCVLAATMVLSARATLFYQIKLGLETELLVCLGMRGSASLDFSRHSVGMSGILRPSSGCSAPPRPLCSSSMEPVCPSRSSLSAHCKARSRTTAPRTCPWICPQVETL
ncbi:hypothetical protein FA95DRAFT_1374593 [Auriscalpium vulgare]|uniref:Uncharacterized protein n=1 Tax=Auriscalpium vulgare TaxID=40419 RepID=A0ACB8RQG2_9AGAM|nr:hypothetical protein FA95DRAFT_1374593 [Auriscalpium vulgare]